MNGDVRAADAEERRRRVVTQNDRLLRLHVTQPEIQRFVAIVSHQKTNHLHVRVHNETNKCELTSVTEVIVGRFLYC